MEKSLTRPQPLSHLICRTGWGFLASAACAYFAYASYVDLRDGNFIWGQHSWNIVTWAVWTILIGALITEVRCHRERILFTILLLVSVLGLAFSLWERATFPALRGARIASLALWLLATAAALFVTFAPERRKALQDP